MFNATVWRADSSAFSAPRAKAMTAVVMLAFALTGCGGSDDDVASSTTAAAVTTSVSTSVATSVPQTATSAPPTTVGFSPTGAAFGDVCSALTQQEIAALAPGVGPGRLAETSAPEIRQCQWNADSNLVVFYLRIEKLNEPGARTRKSLVASQPGAETISGAEVASIWSFDGETSMGAQLVRGDMFALMSMVQGGIGATTASLGTAPRYATKDALRAIATKIVTRL